MLDERFCTRPDERRDDPSDFCTSRESKNRFFHRRNRIHGKNVIGGCTRHARSSQISITDRTVRWYPVAPVADGKTARLFFFFSKFALFSITPCLRVTIQFSTNSVVGLVFSRRNTKTTALYVSGFYVWHHVDFTPSPKKKKTACRQCDRRVGNVDGRSHYIRHRFWVVFSHLVCRVTEDTYFSCVSFVLNASRRKRNACKRK